MIFSPTIRDVVSAVVSGGESPWSQDLNKIYNDSEGIRVGIGTDTPQAKLNVVGNVNVTQNLTVDGSGIFHGEFNKSEYFQRGNVRVGAFDDIYGTFALETDTTSLGGVNSIWIFDNAGDNLRIYEQGERAVARFNNTGFRVGEKLQHADITVVGDLIVDDNMNVEGNSTINVYHGEMWNYTSNATAWDFEFPEGVGVYHNLSNLSSGHLSGFIFTDNDGAEGGSFLTTQVPGNYKISWAISLSSDDNKDLYGFMVAKNFDKNTARECYTRRDFRSRNIVGSIGGTCFLDFDVGDTINFLIENEVDNDGLNIHTFNLNLARFGGINGG